MGRHRHQHRARDDCRLWRLGGRGARSYSHPAPPKAGAAPRPKENIWADPSLTVAQQKEATTRRAQGATLQELADSYDRSVTTMRRNTHEHHMGSPEWRERTLDCGQLKCSANYPKMSIQSYKRRFTDHSRKRARLLARL